MICQDLFSDACPCIRAELADCDYCSLLRGEAVCACDWQGYCLYELYQWRDAIENETAPGAVAAVRSFPRATGLVVKAGADLIASPPGTIVKFPLPPLGGQETAAVLLSVCPEAGFVYLLLPFPCAASLLTGQTLTLRQDGNAFTGCQALAAARSEKIALWAGESFTAALEPLAEALRRQGNRVILLPAGEADVPAGTDILFAAGSANEIKRAATTLPPSFEGKIVTWVTEGLSPQW